ncbi:polyprenyl synthetase family protein [Candidatus Enterococcus leclercqii]|uniref:polyprenyl synthetase family protein n=1 Tax=Candidatus Enterococcus leclercqii TaxID=1857218 RepID=UPI001F432CB8|nr:farnesyl diphosphate synthase [Enterococcus sp. CU9D]KAF1292290.1 geranyl transferase [Enterococcus sp. CU9D]
MTPKDLQTTHLPRVEKEMINFLTGVTTDERLLASMLYSIRAGGKRIRPQLLLAVVSGFDKPVETGVYQTAAALEMIHTYSLIHDDLPAMDDDPLRRGMPTNHIEYGEATAILAGDGLLTEAFHLLSSAVLPAEEKLLLIQLLAKRAGSGGMVAGQAADIQGENQRLSLAELQNIHQRKTGDLLSYALVAGGILAQQPVEVLAQLEQLAAHVGLAFQIRDDLLDVTATTAELGKAAHKDAAAGKNTYPELLGLDKAKEALSDELAAAEKLINELTATLPFSGELLQELLLKFRL